MRLPKRTGRRDKLARLQRQNLAPNDARHRQPLDHTKSDDKNGNTGGLNKELEANRCSPSLKTRVKSIDRNENKNQARDRIKDIHESHHEGIDSPTRISCDKPPSCSNKEAHHRTAKPHKQRNTPPREETIQDIAAIESGAEGVLKGGRRILIRPRFPQSR